MVRAYEASRFICEQYYMTAPELSLRSYDLSAGSVIGDASEPRRDAVECVYVPSHLYHILFELFKNAMRATIEHHGEDAVTQPPIEVLVVKSPVNT